MKHTIKPNDLFVASWGYDQTNINFYQVISINPSGKSMSVRAIKASVTSDGFMSGKSTPLFNNFTSQPMTKLIKSYTNSNGTVTYSFKVNSFSYAYLEPDHNKLHYTSWGH